MASTCTICQQHEETVAHILWECPLARNVWGMIPGQLQKCNLEATNYHILARQLEEKLTKKDLGVIGDGVVVHMEHKKPFPFREEAKHAK